MVGEVSRPFHRMEYWTISLNMAYSLIAIEVKPHYPKEGRFRQLVRYQKFVDAIFLAYPSEWAAEAVTVTEKFPQHRDIWIIAVTPYRSYVILPARSRKRTEEILWRKYSSIAQWKQARSASNNSRWVKIVRELIEDNNTILRKKDWQALACLHVLMKGKEFN